MDNKCSSKLTMITLRNHKIIKTVANKQYKTMGFIRLHIHGAPQQIFVSVDNDIARNPHRFILQHVSGHFKKVALRQ